MLDLLTQNWQLVAVAVGLLLIVVPRLGGVMSAVRAWFPSGGAAKPSQHELVDAYRLLIDSLGDDQAAKALTDHVWPSIGRYRK